jgi:hypothetical protein
MIDQTVTLNFEETAERKAAAEFLRELVILGVTFKAEINHHYKMVISFTGGF